MRTVLALLIGMSAAHSVWAQDYEFRSKLDVFTVKVSGARGELDGQLISTKPMAGVFTLFNAQFEDVCDMSGVGRPDLTITRKSTSGNVSQRMVYISKRLISDGEKRCGSLSGQGLYTLPFHRKWFETDLKITIALKNKFSVWKDGKLVVAFEKTENGYRNTDPAFATNWDFFDKFVFALKEFAIDFRAHPDAAKEFTGFELRDSERTFKFVRVGETTWAVQFPGVPWLAASGQLGLIGDMTPQMWMSPHDTTLKILRDRTVSDGKRLKAAQAVFDRWSHDIKSVFFEVLLSPENSLKLRKDLATLLKQKPTDENFKVLVQLIQKEQDFALLNHVTKILRIKNPKGPVVEEDDDDVTREQKVREWNNWARSHGVM